MHSLDALFLLGRHGRWEEVDGFGVLRAISDFKRGGGEANLNRNGKGYVKM